MMDALDQFAASWLPWMLERSIVFSIVLVSVWILTWALKKRISNNATYLLLLFCLSTLFLPIERVIPWSLPIPSLSPTQITVSDARSPGPMITKIRGHEVAPQPISKAPVSLPRVSTPPHPALAEQPALLLESPPSGRPGLSIATAIFGSWFIIILGLITVFLGQHRALSRRLKRLQPGDTALKRLFASVTKNLGMKRPPPLLMARSRISPVACGLRKSCVIIPEPLVHTLSERHLAWVFAHELLHIKRNDLLVSLFQRVIQILFFFHPLTWILNREIDRHREFACDREARAITPELSGHECAQALLSVVELTQGKRPLPALVAMAGHKSFIRSRIMRLMDESRSITRPSWLCSSLLGILVGASGLATARTFTVSNQAPLPMAESSALGTTSTSKVRPTIEKGVDWLLSQQEPQGSWSFRRDISSVDTSSTERTFDPFSPSSSIKTTTKQVIKRPAPLSYAVGLTGLAVLGLMESNRFEKGSPVWEAWERGLDYLAKQQDESGKFSQVGHSAIYEHLMATQAMLKSLRFKDDSATRERCQKAIDMISRARNPYRAWRYGFVPTGRADDNDTSVTGLAILTLASAQSFGLKIDMNAMECGLLFIEEMTDAESGRTGYISPGGMSSRLAGEDQSASPENSEAMTALALCVRLAMNEKSDSEPVKRGLKLVSQKLPRWQEGHIDLYYWLFGSVAQRALKGESWLVWKKRISEALTKNQDKDGSWSPRGAWGYETGPVYSTVFSVLALAHVDS